MGHPAEGRHPPVFQIAAGNLGIHRFNSGRRGANAYVCPGPRSAGQWGGSGQGRGRHRPARVEEARLGRHGVGGVGWTLQGEVFPTAVRGQAAAFAAMIDWLANFALIEVFPVTQNAISLSGVLVVFAGLCALAIVFVWKFLPETKNLPVEEIIGLFEHQQTTLPEAA